MRLTTLGAAACLAAVLTNAAWAQEFKATRKLTDTQLTFDVGPGLSNYTLTVAGPNGFHTSVSSRDAAPSIDFRQFKLDDGVYNYELTAMTGQRVPVRTSLNNGRDGGPASDSVALSVSASGVLHVKDGTIQKFDPTAREPVSRQK